MLTFEFQSNYSSCSTTDIQRQPIIIAIRNKALDWTVIQLSLWCGVVIQRSILRKVPPSTCKQVYAILVWYLVGWPVKESRICISNIRYGTNICLNWATRHQKYALHAALLSFHLVLWIFESMHPVLISNSSFSSVLCNIISVGVCLVWLWLSCNGWCWR